MRLRHGDRLLQWTLGQRVNHVFRQKALSRVRAWMLLAAARLDGLLTKQERDAIVNDLESLQRADGGWSLADLGVWRWARQEAPFAPPGTIDRALIAQSDGYATGLVEIRRHGRRPAGSCGGGTRTGPPREQERRAPQTG